MEFKVKSEPWAKYKMEDGTLLFGRLIVLKIYKTDQYDPVGQPVYARASQNLFSTICKKEIKGIPSTIPLSSVDPREFNAAPINFDRVGAEEWNVYQLLDGTVISLKLELSSVMRTEKFGPDGDPFYIVNSQVVPRVRVPPNLIRKQTPLPKTPSEKKQLYG